ncbi:MAG: hypothetical protein JO133_05700 [Burkholderiaceae bacterium]|nr:hypothetical protein [Burkholderiaceae bacterium]
MMTEYLCIREYLRALLTLYNEFEGKARASFEGDLQGLGLEELPGTATEECAGLKRQTTWPRQDFAVVQLTRGNIAFLATALAQPDLLGPEGRIIHTQIEMDGELAFAACDNFHEECTYASGALRQQIVEVLTRNGLASWLRH